MAFLLELKESFKKFYNRYNTYVVPASKFIIALICFIMINTSIGYMDKLKNPVFALLLSVICAFLPGGFTLIVLSAFILIQLYVIAPEFALLVLCVMLLMYLLYFRFAPKTAYILIITAMFCWMKIPFVLPVAIGLCSSVAAVIPVSFGVIMYYIIRTASDYEAAISDDSLSESMKQISYLIESLLKNRQMLVLIIAAAVTIIVVYIIRRQKIDHSWKIAIIVGSITQFLILVVGQIALKSDFNIVLIIIGTIPSSPECRYLLHRRHLAVYDLQYLPAYDPQERPRPVGPGGQLHHRAHQPGRPVLLPALCPHRRQNQEL